MITVLRDRMAKQGGVVVMHTSPAKFDEIIEATPTATPRSSKRLELLRNSDASERRRPQYATGGTASNRSHLMPVWQCCSLAFCAAVWNDPKSLYLRRVLFLIT